MKVEVFTCNPFQENSAVVYNDAGDAVIVDPGFYAPHEREALMDFIGAKKLKVHAILNTHCHIDHILGNAYCMDKFDVDLVAHEKELFTLSLGERSAAMYGLEGYVPSPEPTRFVEDNEVIRFGDLEFQVIFGPGHAVGHVAFYNATNNILLGGDIVFKGSFGRVDLPGGDLETLKQTIHQRIFTLPGETVIYSGHGPLTTIGDEKRYNYILQF